MRRTRPLNRQLGGLCLPCRLHLQPTPYDQLEAQARLVEGNTVSLAHTRRFSHADTGTVALSWAPEEGPGLELNSTRQLCDSTSAQLGWVVGPEGSHGMTMGVKHVTDRYKAAGKVQVRITLLRRISRPCCFCCNSLQ